jgi:hypothetical protein
MSYVGTWLLSHLGRHEERYEPPMIMDDDGPLILVHPRADRREPDYAQLPSGVSATLVMFEIDQATEALSEGDLDDVRLCLGRARTVASALADQLGAGTVPTSATNARRR